MTKEKSQKQLQIGEQIKREMAQIFLHDDIFIRNDHFKITVCEADASPDLKNVKVFINIFGDINEGRMIKELNDSNLYFRKKISSSLRLRNIPQIRFILDKTAQNAVDIESKIQKEGKNYSDS